MVRFKVVKASHLLLWAAAILLVIVMGAIILNLVLSPGKEAQATQANFVQVEKMQTCEAETRTVFASLSADGNAFELDPESNNPLLIEIIENDDAPNASAPSVLIYHTHTHEAYEQISDDRYVAIEAWRTIDQNHSIVRVGAELAELLRGYGFQVVHDTTDHEQNALNTAYTRSLETLQSYDWKFDLYIDLHRDAYIDGIDDDVIKSGNQALARIMLLIGNGNGFQEKPYYEENLAFAEALTSRINAIKPGLCKDVLVKDGRYNQHIGIFSVLIEIGHNRNTLNEALAALPYLAQGLDDLMIRNPDGTLQQMQENHSSPSG